MGLSLDFSLLARFLHASPSLAQSSGYGCASPWSCCFAFGVCDPSVTAFSLYLLVNSRPISKVLCIAFQ